MKVYGITDRGAVRKENQDCFRYEAPEGEDIITAVLCDGMGGAQAGSVASNMAADAFMSHAANSLDDESSASDMREILLDAINYANIKVYDKSFSDFACMGMGSTLVALLMNSRRSFVANVGDSRAYLISRRKIEQVTHDHSYVAELFRKGELTEEEARNHPRKNIITRAIGVEASVKCDIFEVKVPSGGVLLLCSDGLSNLVTNEEIFKAVEKSAGPEMAAQKLLALALERGAPDNVTILIAGR